MEHIIQPTDLSAYSRPVSKHLDEGAAYRFIEEAESLDIRPAIGDDIFGKLIARPDEAKNIFLLEGGWYPSNGAAAFTPGVYTKESEAIECDAYFHGLKHAAAYYTLARLVKGNDSQITRFGLVQKDADYSTRPTAQDRNAAYRDLASVGDQYLAEALAFLKVYGKKYTASNKRREIKSNRTKYRVIGE